MRLIYLLALLVSLPVFSNTNPSNSVANNLSNLPLLPVMLPFLGDDYSSDNTTPVANTGELADVENVIPNDLLNRKIEINSSKEEIEQCGDSFSLTSDPTKLSVSCQQLQAALIVERNQLEFLNELIKHNKEIIEHRANTYDLQYYQTIAIGPIVIGIVVTGLILSWKQFTKDTFIQPVTKDSEGSVTLSTSTTTIKLGEYIEISSSVIGLIILFISLFFFDRYITHVYTIHDPLTQSIVEK